MVVVLVVVAFNLVRVFDLPSSLQDAAGPTSICHTLLLYASACRTSPPADTTGVCATDGCCVRARATGSKPTINSIRTENMGHLDGGGACCVDTDRLGRKTHTHLHLSPFLQQPLSLLQPVSFRYYVLLRHGKPSTHHMPTAMLRGCATVAGY